MTDKVIRLEGGHIKHPHITQQLNQYLIKNQGRNFVVVSAAPELLQLFDNTFSTLPRQTPDVDKLQKTFFAIFQQYHAKEITETYRQHTQQAAGLLKGIALTGDYSKALKDQVYSFAEKLTTEILKAKWTAAKILQPEEIQLSTTSDFGNASFISLNHAAISGLKNGIYLLPGTFGITSNNKIARTGKTAADYTAAFLAKELKSNRLELWGLENAFLRSDPAIIKQLPKIKRLTYAEAGELAYFDHYSFHPRTVEPLASSHIPIVVLNNASDDGLVETTINTESFIEKQVVKSVACTDDISLLKLDGPGVGLKPGILAKVTHQLNATGLNIKSVITSQTSINFILSKQNGEKAIKFVEQLGFSAVTNVSVVKDLSMIGIIGHGMQHAFGVSAKIFSAVANNNINVILSGSGVSDLVSYLVVKKEDKAKSVREIYKAFF